MRKHVMRADVLNNSEYNLFFARTKIHRLSTPHQQKCVIYSHNYSRILCYHICIKDTYKYYNNCVSPVVPLIHNSSDDDYIMCRYNHLNDSFHSFADRKCDKKCPIECKEEYYEYEILGPRKRL